MTIRAFSPEHDYEALAALKCAVDPDYPCTAAELRAWDSGREEKIRHHLLVTEHDGVLIAAAKGANSPWSYHPTQFHLDLEVHPAHQGKGVGRALYGHLMSALAPYTPTRLSAYTREDRPAALSFLTNRGYTEVLRAWESRLDPSTVDLSQFSEADARPQAAGLRLTDFATLEAEEGEEAYRKLYDMELEVDQDVPRAEGETPSMMSYENWRKRMAESVRFRAESFFVAVAPQGEYAGVSMLFHPQSGNYLETGLTGVRRAWRRHGIALALKLRAVRYAQERGVPQIRTDNAQQNRPMLSINETLGFVKQPAWIEFAKTAV